MSNPDIIISGPDGQQPAGAHSRLRKEAPRAGGKYTRLRERKEKGKIKHHARLVADDARRTEMDDSKANLAKHEALVTQRGFPADAAWENKRAELAAEHGVKKRAIQSAAAEDQEANAEWHDLKGTFNTCTILTARPGVTFKDKRVDTGPWTDETVAAEFDEIEAEERTDAMAIPPMEDRLPEIPNLVDRIAAQGGGVPRLVGFEKANGRLDARWPLAAVAAEPSSRFPDTMPAVTDAAALVCFLNRDAVIAHFEAQVREFYRGHNGPIMTPDEKTRRAKARKARRKALRYIAAELAWQAGGNVRWGKVLRVRWDDSTFDAQDRSATEERADQLEAAAAILGVEIVPEKPARSASRGLDLVEGFID